MILITGGAGFIGSNLVLRLNKTTEEGLVVCDTLGTQEKWKNLQHARIKHFIFPDQLRDFLSEHASHISTIFHLGAISSTTETDVNAIIRHNFQLSTYLWQWCAHHHVPFIYASSAATYGDGTQGFEDDVEKLHTLKPLNPYGWSKYLFDCWVKDTLFQKEPKPPQWAGLKFFNVYGPREGHKGDQRSVVSKFYAQFTEAPSSAVARLFKSYRSEYPHGMQKRDFIWVEDCIDVMLWLRDHPEISDIFNVGTGHARTFNDLVHALFQVLHLPAHITYIDMPPSLRPHYQYFTEAPMHKLRAVGYVRPFTSLEEGINLSLQNISRETL